MSFTIPPDSPKAVIAQRFGREMVKACKARNIPLNELERSLGVGHTTLDNYRRGLSLPKTATAIELSIVLDWPRLAEIVKAYRTMTCKRDGCERRFTNETGAPRKYHSEQCRKIAENIRMAATRARSAGQTGDHHARRAVIQRLRSAVTIADEQVALQAGAIAAMCDSCEPEGICHVPDCPLRQYSPLPLERHGVPVGRPRTRDEIWSAAWTPERRANLTAKLKVAHAEGRMPPPPGFTDEQRAKGQATIKSDAHRRKVSQTSKDMWARKRAT